ASHAHTAPPQTRRITAQARSLERLFAARLFPLRHDGLINWVESRRFDLRRFGDLGQQRQPQSAPGEEFLFAIRTEQQGVESFLQSWVTGQCAERFGIEGE